jgi:hypothetical protein
LRFEPIASKSLCAEATGTTLSSSAWMMRKGISIFGATPSSENASAFLIAASPSSMWPMIQRKWKADCAVFFGSLSSLRLISRCQPAKSQCSAAKATRPA